MSVDPPAADPRSQSPLDPKVAADVCGVADVRGVAEDVAAQTPPSPPSSGWLRLSLRECFALVTIAVLGVAMATTVAKLRRTQAELSQLRAEAGYLTPSDEGQIAAARVPSDEPLTYRMRIRIPENASTDYRVAYSSIWRKDQIGPEWFSAIVVPKGESLVTVRVHRDPRDERWKLTTLVRSATEGTTRRMSTVLPPDHVNVFRGSHDVLSTGVTHQTVVVEAGQPLRVLDERWLVGEEGLLLYGNRAPRRDQIGVYAELQPDVGPLRPAVAATPNP